MTDRYDINIARNGSNVTICGDLLQLSLPVRAIQDLRKRLDECLAKEQVPSGYVDCEIFEEGNELWYSRCSSEKSVALVVAPCQLNFMGYVIEGKIYNVPFIFKNTRGEIKNMFVCNSEWESGKWRVLRASHVRFEVKP